MSDANINGAAVIDGGAVFTGASPNYTSSNLGNADVIEVRDAAVVTIGDLSGVSNIGTLQFTNDTAAVQTSTLQLDDATVDRLVNTTEVAGAINPVTTLPFANETLFIQAFDNPLLPGPAGATTVLNIDATAMTSGFLNLNVLGASGNDVITLGAGNDTVAGGLGNDIISLGTGTDQVQFRGSPLIAAGAAGNFVAGSANADVITGFTAGALSGDTLSWFLANIQNGTSGPTIGLSGFVPVAVADGGAATANDVIFTFSGAGDNLGATTVATAVANAVTALTSGADFAAANVATGDSLVLVLGDNAGNSWVFNYLADAVPATTTAADLMLVAEIVGVTPAQFVAGDFV